MVRFIDLILVRFTQSWQSMIRNFRKNIFLIGSRTGLSGTKISEDEIEDEGDKEDYE